jgi:hypothetical protein
MLPIPLETKRLLALRERVEHQFTSGDWAELGIISNCSDIINQHHRLLRSLTFNDSDYRGNVLDVLNQIIRRDPENFSIIEGLLEGNISYDDRSVSSETTAGRRFYIQPTAFSIPEEDIDSNLLAVMMPFNRKFDDVYNAISSAARKNCMRVERADHVWQNSAIIQDIFSLIFRSSIVVCDFSEENTNVFYETGIAHTLGKHVVPIAQSIKELPFDLKHHRAIIYPNNNEGHELLEARLGERLSFLRSSA